MITAGRIRWFAKFYAGPLALEGLIKCGVEGTLQRIVRSVVYHGYSAVCLSREIHVISGKCSTFIRDNNAQDIESCAPYS